MADLAWVWGKWEQDVISFEQHWYMLTFAYKWLGDKKVRSFALPQFKEYRKDKTNDRALCQKLWELFDEADIVIAHNGDAFDIKKAQARFVQHGFKPPTPFASVDTKKVAKKYFKFDSNSLNDLGQYLNIGKKVRHEGFEMWLDCAVRDRRDGWRKMIKYNEQDIVLLEKVYLALRPWMTNHPNANQYLDRKQGCPNCGSPKVTRAGTRVMRAEKKQRWHCQDCGAWRTSPFKEGALIR